MGPPFRTHEHLRSSLTHPRYDLPVVYFVVTFKVYVKCRTPGMILRQKIIGSQSLRTSKATDGNPLLESRKFPFDEGKSPLEEERFGNFQTSHPINGIC